MTLFLPRRERAAVVPDTACPIQALDSQRSASRRALLRGGAVGVSALTVGGLTTAPALAASIPAGIPGQDVSPYQGRIDWKAQMSKGSRYAFIKATEGNTWHSSTFSQQYSSATKAGIIRGAYHFARPDSGGPERQVDAFLNGGGGWSADGRTLPGMLDLESVSGVPVNFGLSKKELRTWIAGFIAAYKSAVGRRPIVYTNAHWWDTNVGNFAPAHTPMHIAYYSSKKPTNMPGRWTDWDMWQFSDSAPFAGDSSVFQGSKSAFSSFVSDKNYAPRGI